MGAGVVWGAPGQNVKITIFPVSRSFAAEKTCAHSNRRQGPTNLQVGAISCSCGEKQIIWVSWEGGQPNSGNAIILDAYGRLRILL